MQIFVCYCSVQVQYSLLTHRVHLVALYKLELHTFRIHYNRHAKIDIWIVIFKNTTNYMYKMEEDNAELAYHTCQQGHEPSTQLSYLSNTKHLYKGFVLISLFVFLFLNFVCKG